MSAERPGKLTVDDLNDDELAVALIVGAVNYGWDYQAAVGLILGQRDWLCQDEFRSAVEVDMDVDGRPAALVRWADIELTCAASAGQEKLLEFARSLAGVVNTRPLGELLSGLGGEMDRVLRAVEYAGRGWSPTPGPSAVVLDPTGGELVNSLWAIHDWARFGVGPEEADGQAVVDRLADIVADVAEKLHAERKTAPSLYSPDGREVASLVAVEADLCGIAPALQRARQVAYDDDLPRDLLKAVDLLDRCGLCARSEDGRLLASLARSGRRGKRLDDRQFQAYQRFARLVLIDPLDQFQAVGLDPAPRAAIEPDPTGWPSDEPEIDL